MCGRERDGYCGIAASSVFILAPRRGERKFRLEGKSGDGTRLRVSDRN